METKSCTFFGHRAIAEADAATLGERVRAEILICIRERNITDFYFGGFSAFDDLCFEIVTALRAEYPYLRRIFCVADERWLRPSKRPRWLRESDFEEIVSLPLECDYWRTRIYYRNCAMIDASDVVICYLRKTEGSGARKACNYAEKCKKSIVLV